MENKIKRIPIARCPNPDCSRTLLFSCDPKDKLRITTKIADEYYQGKTMICSRCKTTVAIIEKPKVARGYVAYRFTVQLASKHMNYYEQLKNIISNPDWNRWDYYRCHERDTVESIFKDPSEFIDWTFLHAKKHMLTSSVVDGKYQFDVQKISSPRAAHSVSSFFLGFILIDGLMEGNLNRFCSFENIAVEYPFTYVWNLTSLYHDFGYQYEQDASLRERIVRKLGNARRTPFRCNFESIDALRKELDVKHSVWTPSFYYRKNYNRNRFHMLLHEAMDGAVKEGLIPFNPTEATTIPKNEKTEKAILLESQIETFMQALEGDEIWHDFFYTAIMTGMRRGEICGLKWTDFNEEYGTLHIQRSVRYARGIYIVGETKTNEGNRKIVLPASVAEMLKERKKKALTEWIFPKPYYPEHPMIPESAYTQLKKLLKKAGLPDMRFHDLRHTFATHAASNGIDPKTLASLLGHTKASFTLDRYTHVTTDMQRQASGIVGNFITDMFGEELKPWQDEENQAKAQ